jgi:hypothetical protein
MTIMVPYMTMNARSNDDSFCRMPSDVTMWAGDMTVRTGHVTVKLDATFFKLIKKRYAAC